MTITTIETIDPVLWNAHAVHPMQSYEWGEARKKLGTQVVRFGVYENEKIAQVFQMTVHSLPLGYAIGYIARSTVPSPTVVAYIRSFARARKIIFVKWEPYVRFEQENELAQLPGMHLSSHPLFTEWNLEVDLTPSLDAILAKFSKNTRYAIRYAEKNGVAIKKVDTEEGFDIFADLYFKTCARQGYYGHTKKYHRVLWETLSKSGICFLYIAYYNGKPHTAFEIFLFGNRAYYPYSGSSGEHRTISASQLLMWQVIQDAKAQGATVLDLWGALPQDYAPNNPWAGFTFFKQGFGSSYAHMARGYDQVISLVLYILYGFAHRIRRLLLSSKLR